MQPHAYLTRQALTEHGNERPGPQCFCMTACGPPRLGLRTCYRFDDTWVAQGWFLVPNTSPVLNCRHSRLVKAGSVSCYVNQYQPSEPRDRYSRRLKRKFSDMSALPRARSCLHEWTQLAAGPKNLPSPRRKEYCSLMASRSGPEDADLNDTCPPGWCLEANPVCKAPSPSSSKGWKWPWDIIPSWNTNRKHHLRS
jgi:hypothetical protein